MRGKQLLTWLGVDSSPMPAAVPPSQHTSLFDFLPQIVSHTKNNCFVPKHVRAVLKTKKNACATIEVAFFASLNDGAP